MKTLYQKIDKHLYLNGMTAQPIRRIVLLQLFLAVPFLVLGLALAYFSVWPLMFGVGAALSGYNFWHIARFVQRRLYHGYSKATALRLFLSFNCRFLLTGLVLFLLIVRLHAPLVPLVAGLTAPVATIVIWGIRAYSDKPVKEA